MPPSSPLVKNNKIQDETDENELVYIDCQLVEFLKDEILSQSTNVPREFIMRVVVLLNRGSVLSTTTASAAPSYPYGIGGTYLWEIDNQNYYFDTNGVCTNVDEEMQGRERGRGQANVRLLYNIIKRYNLLVWV